MQRLRALCDEHGIMLIADKCRAARGVPARCLRWSKWACTGSHHLCEIDRRRFPAGGRPGRAEVMDAVAPGGLGGTYAVTRLPAWLRWKC